jgi:hypothetical protein
MASDEPANEQKPVTHTQAIGVKQPQVVSMVALVLPPLLARGVRVIDLRPKIIKLLRWVAPVVAQLRRRGRPRVYDHDAAITGVAEEVILIRVKTLGVDDKLDWFIERVWTVCKKRKIKVPENKSAKPERKWDTTTMYEICAPIYNREHAKIAKT